MVARLRLLLDHIDGAAIEYDGHHFGGVDVQGSVLEAYLAQRLRGLILELELSLQVGGSGDFWRGGSGGFEPCADGVVSELRLVADDGAIDVARLERAGGIDDKLDDDGGAVDIGEQRRGSGGKLFGEHGEIADAGVDGGGLAGGVLVDGRGFGDESVDVGDADHDFDAAIGKALGDFDLVEVLRSVVVNRRPQQIAEIAHAVCCG